MTSRRRQKRIPLLVAMLERGHSVRTLAAESGVSHAHLSRIICNRVDHPKPATRQKLASALGVPAAKLFPEDAP